jgi:hypothetical protein
VEANQLVRAVTSARACSEVVLWEGGGVTGSGPHALITQE